jgi:hypothetical protein
MGLRLDLYQYGVDALPNLFEVVFHGLPSFVGDGGGDSARLGGRPYQGLENDKPCMRVTKFPIPASGVQTKNVHFMGGVVKLPVSKLDIDPMITLGFRIDQYWQMYRDLCTWRNKVADPGTAKTGMDTFNLLTNKLLGTRCDSMEVRTTMRDHTNVNFRAVRWVFPMACPFKTSGPQFDYTTGGTESITIDVDFGYVMMQEHFADELYETSFKQYWKRFWNGI